MYFVHPVNSVGGIFYLSSYAAGQITKRILNTTNMKPDRTLISLWEDTAEVKKTTHKHSTDIKGDVIIIGNGITAYTTALILQQEGKQCVLVSAVDIVNYYSRDRMPQHDTRSV